MSWHENLKKKIFHENKGIIKNCMLYLLHDKVLEIREKSTGSNTYQYIFFIRGAEAPTVVAEPQFYESHSLEARQLHYWGDTLYVTGERYCSYGSQLFVWTFF